MSRAVALVLALSVVAAAPSASAQDVPERQVAMAQKEGRLVATFDASSALTDSGRRRLRSGLPSQLVIRAVLTPEGRSEPVGFGAQTCRVAYDLWEEVFRVVVSRPGSERRLELRSESAVVSACARVQDLPVAHLAELDERRSYRLAVLAELNPIDRRTLSAIRRWLAHPGGQSASERGGLFGSFASVFVNRRIGGAESTLRFRSQRFRVRFEAPATR